MTTVQSDRKLDVADDYLHPAGVESNWNESRYVDFHDPVSGVGGWFRIGMRPNEGHAEMSACVTLPDGRCAFYFKRAQIDANGLVAGGQEWLVGDPYRRTIVRYDGPLAIFDDPWMLSDPKSAFASAAQESAAVELQVDTDGLGAVMGSDQAHIDRIFLPGQADWHYQHLCRVRGTVRVGGETFRIDGVGGKDHSWGPRNWLAKIYLRWLIGYTDDRRLGFMLVRGVGPTKQTRSGFVWDDGTFHVVDDFDMHNEYEHSDRYRMLRSKLAIRSGEREWTAVGTPEQWLPLRHLARDEHGNPAQLRIVKSPTRWQLGDGRLGAGMSEIHDRLDADGRPAGLHD
jgi:hypothetical protein